MPYIATKDRKIAGRVYQRGQVVDTSSLEVAKLSSLLRVGLIVQKDDPSVIKAMVPDLCEVCGEGPFRRLDMHMRKHEEEENEADGPREEI